VPQSFDAGYRLTSDATVLWQAFENAHHKASLPGILDLLWNHSHALSRSCSRTASSGMPQATAPTQLFGLTRCVTTVKFSLDMPPDPCLRRRKPAARKPSFPNSGVFQVRTPSGARRVFNLKWTVPGKTTGLDFVEVRLCKRTRCQFPRSTDRHRY
jgi:hypothetical protein